MPRTIQHAHKLKRHKYKTTGNAIFFCVLPDCSFKSEVPLMLGKKNICWVCGKEFVMNEYSIRSARPRCMNCIKHKNPTEAPTTEVLAEVAVTTSSDLADRLRRSLTAAGVRNETRSDNGEDI